MTQTPGTPGPSSGRSPVDPDNASAAPPPPYGGYPVFVSPPPSKKGGMFTRILMGLFASVLIFSLLSNFYLTQIVATLMSGPHEESYQPGGDANQRIVILPVEGVIDDSTAVFVRRAFDVIRQNSENLPKAIVLRVDSPGGYVGASDRIYHELIRFKTEYPMVPVVVSMGSVAASGGYYVSAAGDHILAEPTCVTGSIGVILQAATVEELLKNIGVAPVVLVADTSPRKDVANNIFRAWTDEDFNKMKVMLNSAHARFMKVVADGRKAVLTEEQVRVLSNGDIYMTAEAVANKLIDGEGYLDDAIAEAKKRAGLKVEPKVSIIRQAHGFNPLNLLGKAEHSLPRNGKELGAWLRDAAEPTMEYRWVPGR
ncbi:MAG: signal peptide peptidase SppA [Phycisphaeraceae bacterium]